MKNLLSARFKLDASNTVKPSASASQWHLIKLVRSKLNDGSYKFVSDRCICGVEGKDTVISEIDRYRFPLTSVLCMSCGTVRIDPYLDEDSLRDFYTHIYREMYGFDDESGNYDTYFIRQSRYATNVIAASQNFLRPGSWVCEVGCGGGGALKVFQDQGYNVAGCDYDPKVLEVGKQNGVKNLYYGSLETIGNHLDGVKFDLIYMHHVFEHVVDLMSLLEVFRKYLTPQGRVIIIVPDISRIDQFGHLPAIGNLLMYLHIAHKYNFSLEGLRRLCGRAGFSIEKLNSDNMIKTSWSESPEMWIQMKAESEVPLEGVADQSDDNAGSKMLKYLQRTEKLHALGLCKGQVIDKLNTLRSPEKVFKKLQRFTSKNLKTKE